MPKTQQQKGRKPTKAQGALYRRYPQMNPAVLQAMCPTRSPDVPLIQRAVERHLQLPQVAAPVIMSIFVGSDDDRTLNKRALDSLADFDVSAAATTLRYKSQRTWNPLAPKKTATSADIVRFYRFIPRPVVQAIILASGGDDQRMTEALDGLCGFTITVRRIQSAEDLAASQMIRPLERSIRVLQSQFVELSNNDAMGLGTESLSCTIPPDTHLNAIWDRVADADAALAELMDRVSRSEHVRSGELDWDEGNHDADTSQLGSEVRIAGLFEKFQQIENWRQEALRGFGRPDGLIAEVSQ